MMRRMERSHTVDRLEGEKGKIHKSMIQSVHLREHQSRDCHGKGIQRAARKCRNQRDRTQKETEPDKCFERMHIESVDIRRLQRAVMERMDAKQDPSVEHEAMGPVVKKNKKHQNQQKSLERKITKLEEKQTSLEFELYETNDPEKLKEIQEQLSKLKKEIEVNFESLMAIGN